MIRGFFGKISLKLKILSLALGLTSLLGVSSMYLVSGLAQKARNSIVKTFEIYTTHLQTAIAGQFSEQCEDLRTFSENPILQSGRREELIKHFNQWITHNEYYDLILYVDIHGRLIGVNDKDTQGNRANLESLYQVNYQNSIWFKSVLAGHFTQKGDPAKSGVYFEEPHIDPITSKAFGDQRYGTSFTTPVKNSRGEVIGVLTGRTRLGWIESEFQNLYLALKAGGFSKSELALMDKSGTILLDYDPSLRGDRIDFVYDFSVIGKLNLVQSGVEIAKKALQGESGAELAYHYRKNVQVVSGYSPIRHGKFPNSLKWSILIRAEPHDAFKSIDTMERLFFAVFSSILGLAVLLSLLFSNSLGKIFYRLADQLKGSTEEVAVSSKQVAHASISLSNSTTEQSAALQETVAAITEMSAMVGKNADNAQKSQEVSEFCQATAEKGKKTVNQMITTIEDINQCNSKIIQEINAGHQEISNIVKFIIDIGNKTRVINDIVFQTRLVSFNASIEAARAGDQGRGFAVVAKEVGNLAKMSGQAAEEISEIVNTSIKNVESIIQNSKARVEHLMVSGKEKVETGTVMARKCGEVLGEIVQNVHSVNQMVEEIARASQEQAQGVVEISKAMHELDEVTQLNASASHNCSEASDILKNQANQMKGIVRNLLSIIRGEILESREQGNPGLKSEVHEGRVGAINPDPLSGGVPPLPEGRGLPRLDELNKGIGNKLNPTHPQQNLTGKKRFSFSKHTPENTVHLKQSEIEEQIPSENDPRFQDV